MSEIDLIKQIIKYKINLPRQVYFIFYLRKGEEMRYDLHVHTNFSDGKFTPSKVVDLAIERNLDGIAITDHDTISAIEEAIEYNKKLKIIPGIELGTIYNNEEVHILGYFIDYKSKKLLKSLDELKKNRIHRGMEIIKKLQALDIKISQKEVQAISKDDFVGRVHIARVLVNKKYVSSISEAFDKYLNIGRPAYVLRKTLTIKESIDLINESNGIAVIAHPGLLKEKNKIINYCIENGIQGIECIHSKHSKEDTGLFIAIANKNHLLITGGSDCHGEIIDNDLLLGQFYIGQKEFLEIEESI